MNIKEFEEIIFYFYKKSENEIKITQFSDNDFKVIVDYSRFTEIFYYEIIEKKIHNENITTLLIKEKLKEEDEIKDWTYFYIVKEKERSLISIEYVIEDDEYGLMYKFYEYICSLDDLKINKVLYEKFKKYNFINIIKDGYKEIEIVSGRRLKRLFELKKENEFEILIKELESK